MHNSSCLIIMIETNAESKSAQAIKDSWSLLISESLNNDLKVCLLRRTISCDDDLQMSRDRRYPFEPK